MKKLVINYDDKDIETFTIYVDGIDLNKRAILKMFDYWAKRHTKVNEHGTKVCNTYNLKFRKSKIEKEYE